MMSTKHFLIIKKGLILFYYFFKQNMKKNLKGFTLVEVLIVIIIVGILIAALLPRLTGGQARARDLSRQLQVNQVGNAFRALIAEHGSVNQTGAVCILTGGEITVANGADLQSYLSSTTDLQDPNGTPTGAFGVSDCD